MIGIAIFAAVRYLLPVLISFIAAFLIAGLIQIPVKRIGGTSRKRQKIAAAFFCILCYAVFFLLVVVLGIKLVQGAGGIVSNAPSIYNEMVAPVLGEVAKRLELAAASVDTGLSQAIDRIFSDFSQNIGQYITDLSMQAVRLLAGGATRIPGLIVKLVVTVVATFFMAMDFDSLISFFKKMIPAEKEKTVGNTLAHVKNILFIYLKSYFLLFLLTFAELFVGFLILRIPYAGALAFAIAVFDILPVLGTGGILLPWAAVLLIMGKTPLALGMLVLYIVITAVRNTLEPRIVGKQIGLPPLVTLIAMFIGLGVLGIAGMVIFPVGLSVFVSLEKGGVIHIFPEKMVKKSFKGEN